LNYDPDADLAGQEHVILDALSALAYDIEAGATPWANYTDGEDAPSYGDLSDESTYRDLLAEAQAVVTVRLEGR